MQTEQGDDIAGVGVEVERRVGVVAAAVLRFIGRAGIADLRFVMGVGRGAELIIGYAALGEFVPSLARGRFGAILALLTNLSVTATGIVGYWAIPALGWRSMFALVGLGAVGIWFLRKSMPESPRWLESQGRHEEADALLRSIEARFAERAAWSDALASVTAASIDAAPVAAAPGYSALFKRPLLSRTVLAMIMSAVNMSVLYGLIAWFPRFLVKQGIAVTSRLGYTAVMGIGTPVGCLIGIALTDRIGRRLSIVGVLALEAIATALYPMAHTPIELMATGAVIMMCSGCITSLAFAVYIPELFSHGTAHARIIAVRRGRPSRVRGHAGWDRSDLRNGWDLRRHQLSDRPNRAADRRVAGAGREHACPDLGRDRAQPRSTAPSCGERGAAIGHARPQHRRFGAAIVISRGAACHTAPALLISFSCGEIPRSLRMSAGASPGTSWL
ncbi:MFS transporter [Burkholderia sp. WSM2232]|uniref:MFS transporter n=1 Tax=Burkholderia sp. WSM2232 TaxID=944436 RepID=UPI000687AD41|nr:MFS transporter [Burkholderia sp. WSM2232]